MRKLHIFAVVGCSDDAAYLPDAYEEDDGCRDCGGDDDGDGDECDGECGGCFLGSLGGGGLYGVVVACGVGIGAGDVLCGA